jgi:hypothetical protein
VNNRLGSFESDSYINQLSGFGSCDGNFGGCDAAEARTYAGSWTQGDIDRYNGYYGEITQLERWRHNRGDNQDYIQRMLRQVNTLISNVEDEDSWTTTCGTTCSLNPQSALPYCCRVLAADWPNCDDGLTWKRFLNKEDLLERSRTIRAWCITRIDDFARLEREAVSRREAEALRLRRAQTEAAVAAGSEPTTGERIVATAGQRLTEAEVAITGTAEQRAAVEEVRLQEERREAAARQARDAEIARAAAEERARVARDEAARRAAEREIAEANRELAEATRREDRARLDQEAAEARMRALGIKDRAEEAAERNKLIAILALGLIVCGGAAYYFFGR